ncbi:MAG: hypothetical protein WA777_15690 [Rhodanobacter sp.]
MTDRAKVNVTLKVMKGSNSHPEFRLQLFAPNSRSECGTFFPLCRGIEMKTRLKHTVVFSVDPRDIDSTDDLLMSMSPDVAYAAAHIAAKHAKEGEVQVRSDDLGSIARMIERMSPHVAEDFAKRAAWRAIS